MFHQPRKGSFGYIPTPDAVRVETLWRSIRRLSENLLKTKQRRTHPGFNDLGHCLLLLQQPDEACISFQQKITLDERGCPAHDIICDICKKADFTGPRFVCKTCADIDLCSTCMPKYHEVEMGVCHGHEFLEIPWSPPDPTEHKITDVISDEMQEWLRRLIERCAERESSSDNSSQAP